MNMVVLIMQDLLTTVEAIFGMAFLITGITFAVITCIRVKTFMKADFYFFIIVLSIVAVYGLKLLCLAYGF